MNTLKRAKVLAIVAKIPPGKVMTYASLARAAGMPRAVRYMGTILGSNEHLITIPCHRVVRSDGTIGGYRGGATQKAALLMHEQIPVHQNRIAHFSDYLFSL